MFSRAGGLTLSVVTMTVLISAAWAGDPPKPKSRGGVAAPAAAGFGEGTEGSHVAGEYYAARSGSVWRYAAGKDRPSVTISAVEDWKAHFSVGWGKRSTSGTWRVKDGAWLEHLSGRNGETVVLPATVQVGTRWKAPSSLERSGKDDSTYEVLATDATVEWPEQSYEKCLAVLETPDGGGDSYTHFYAPNVGKVGVKSGGDDWLLRLVDYKPGRRVNGD